MHSKFVDRWVKNWFSWRKQGMNPAEMIARLHRIPSEERVRVRLGIKNKETLNVKKA